MQVLVVEDEKRLAALIRQGLAEEGHSVVVAHDGREGLDTALAGRFDAIILDVMLPVMDGLAVARRLRQARNQTPILMLTARDSTADVIGGLDQGADDYLTKPFRFDVLLARLRAVSRRGPVPRPVRLQVGDLVLNTASRQVLRGNQPVRLTRTEYSLLEFLLRRAGRVVSRDAILDGVWGLDKDVEANTLEAFIRLLRTKIDQGRAPKLIHTVRGVGYCLREEAE
jgi:two-component system response regulator MprA